MGGRRRTKVRRSLIVNVHDIWLQTVMCVCMTCSCSDAVAGGSSASCCHQNRDSQRGREEFHPAAQRWVSPSAGCRQNSREIHSFANMNEKLWPVQKNTYLKQLSFSPRLSRDAQQAVGLTNGVVGCHSMRLECWSCSPVRRKACGDDQAGRGCGHAHCSLLTPETPAWGENSDSGQGTFSQPTGKGTNELETSQCDQSLEDGETDPDDTSAFDYSSVTSCSPDGTLCREMMDSGEDEEDSQVPVLLKPSLSQQQSRDAPRERTVCLRWQIPRLTPHPPLRHPARQCVEAPMPCPISSYGKRLVNVKKGSPLLHPKSAFRPIWDDPYKQVITPLLHKCKQHLSILN